MPSLDSWLELPAPNPQARLRLFCFPYAGGGASIYRAWPRHLPPDVEVWAIQLPGRETRLFDTPFTRVDPLVRALHAALQPHLQRPFAFFGHSLGALLAFECARTLSAAGRVPAHLFVSGCRAPQLPPIGEPIHALPDRQFVHALRRLQGTPEEVLRNSELMDLLLPRLRADFALAETYAYVPGPALPCPISAYGGIADSEVTQADLAAWRQHTARGFSLHRLPGDHFFIHHNEAQLLHSLSSELMSIKDRPTDSSITETSSVCAASSPHFHPPSKPPAYP